MKQFSMEVRVELSTGDDSWTPKYLKGLSDLGFTMKGGLHVFLVLTSDTDPELGTAACVNVARRLERVAREPVNGNEASLPEFMEYRAFPTNTGHMEWGAMTVNSLIAANGGKLPKNWLAMAMDSIAMQET